MNKVVIFLSILSILSFILSIIALIISNKSNKSPVFSNNDIILETKTNNRWKFTESINGGLCFYATKSDGKNTIKSCIEVVDGDQLYLQNFSNSK